MMYIHIYSDGVGVVRFLYCDFYILCYRVVYVTTLYIVCDSSFSNNFFLKNLNMARCQLHFSERDKPWRRAGQ